jgi:hypothetical protein
MTKIVFSYYKKMSIPLSLIPKCHLLKKNGGMSINEVRKMFHQVKLPNKQDKDYTKQEMCALLKVFYKNKKLPKKTNKNKKTKRCLEKINKEGEINLICEEDFDDFDLGVYSKPKMPEIFPYVYDVEELSDVSDLSSDSEFE